MKKKIITLALLFAIIGVCFAANTIVVPIDRDGLRVDPGQVYTLRTRWQVADDTSSTGDEPTDLAVTERTYQTVKTAIGTGASGDDKISVFDIPRSWNAIRLRAIGITDDGDYVNQIYIGTLGDGNKDSDSTTADCELTHLGQLAWIVGTQASITSAYELADAVTLTATEWSVGPKWSVKSPGSNRVAEAKIDTEGADVLIIVSTIVDADSKLLITGF